MSIRYLTGNFKIVRGPLLWWQKRGLSYTATGYGSKIPTEYQVLTEGRTYRVYVMVYSNSASAYIVSRGSRFFLHDYDFPSR